MSVAVPMHTTGLAVIPLQYWFGLLQADALVPPGCVISPIISISGFSTIKGTLMASQPTVLYFWQIPQGATIAPICDFAAIPLGENVPNKWEYTVNHPFMAFAINPTVATQIRVDMYGIPVHPLAIDGVDDEY